MATTKKTELVEIKPIELHTIVIRAVGTTPLITHCWSEKARKEMLEKMMRKTKTAAKEAKDPVAEFIDSMYWLSGKPEKKTEEAFLAAIESGARFGFPATAFKQAAVSAAFRKGWTKDKMSARGAFFLRGDENQMVEIVSDPPIMREDNVKIGMGAADLRYRGEFRNWHADLTIDYDANGTFTAEQIVNMFQAAGFVCGIGEWRPERDGQNGMFTIRPVE